VHQYGILDQNWCLKVVDLVVLRMDKHGLPIAKAWIFLKNFLNYICVKSCTEDSAKIRGGDCNIPKVEPQL
jgi:hypothetical protein